MLDIAGRWLVVAAGAESAGTKPLVDHRCPTCAWRKRLRPGQHVRRNRAGRPPLGGEE
jgi:hypothetical protein